jgi:hypothetical protein
MLHAYPQRGATAEPTADDHRILTVTKRGKQRLIGSPAQIKLTVADKAASAEAKVGPDQLL